MARGVNVLKTEIVLGYNSVIQGTRQVYNAFMSVNKSIDSVGKQMNALQRTSAQTEVHIKGLTSTLLGMAGTLRTLDKINSMFTSVLGGAYNYSKTLETNAVGISGILTSMVKVNGKQLQWNESMRMSVGIMNELRKQALQTSATAPELIDTFRALLGPGLGSGMKIDEIMKLTKVGVTAVKSIGLDGTQLVQELRSMIQGSIRPASSTLATALGITNTDVKNAKASAEGLYQFLMKRLIGFEKSVQATAGTVQGRLDILKEGIYQGIEAGTQNLWNDFKEGLYNLTENFLTFDKKTKEISLNPKFVENVKSVSDIVMTIKDSFSFLTKDLIKDAGSIAKALAWGAIIKLSGSALNSFISIAANGASSVLNFAKGLSLSNIELEKQMRFEQSLFEFSNQYDKKLASQKELNALAKSLNNEIYNLAKRYRELGANAEQAQKWQNEIVKAINNGQSVFNIKQLIGSYNDLAVKMKSVNEQNIANAQAEKIATEQKLAKDKEDLALQERIAKLRKEATQGLVGAIGVGSKNANADNVLANKMRGGDRTDSSLSAFEKQVMSYQKFGLDRLYLERQIAGVKQFIWQGDFNSASEVMKSTIEILSEHKTLTEQEQQRLAIEKEVAKAQREQYQWLNKQIEANVRLANSKPKFTEQQQQFNLFKRSVTDSIADAKADKQNAKLSKDQQYIQAFIEGKTKSKAYNDENVAMVKSLMEKVQEAGFSKQQADEYAKTFINKLQSGKVSAEKTKQFYEESIKQLEQVKQKYAEIKTESDAIFNKAINAGLMSEQAQKLKEAYVAEMTNGSRESAKAWREAFDKNIQQVQEKINGVMRGVRTQSTNSFANTTFSASQNKSNAQNELTFDYQRTIEAYKKVSLEGAKQIESAFATIKKAQSEELLTVEQASKLELEYRLKVVGGYYDEALAIQKVIEEQYKAGTLASENAKKERELASEKAKTGSIEKQNAITKQWINELEGNVLSQQQRNAIETNTRLALQGKGYTNTEQAVKRLLETEAKMSAKIKETGQIAPPVYTEIIKLVQKLTTATHDLTEEERKHIETIIKESKEYTKLEGAMAVLNKGAGALFSSLTSVGFVLQGVGIEASSSAGRFAEFAIQVGFVGSTVLSLTNNLKDLWGTIKAMSLAGAFKVLGIGGLVGGVAAGIYAYKEGLSLNEIKRRYFEGNKDKAEQGRWLDTIDEGEGFEYSDWSETHKGIDFSNTTVANPQNDDDGKASKKAEQERKRLEALRKQIEDAVQSYKILNETVGISSGKLTGEYTKYQEAIDGAVKKTDQWKKSLKDLVVKSGGAIGEDGEITRYGKITKDMYDETIKSFEKYEDLVKQKAQEDADIQNYENQLSRIKNLEAIQELTAQEANQRRARTLEAEISYYDQLLEKHNYTEDEKLKYETIIAEKRKALREAEETDGKVHWDNVLAHIKETTFNQTAVVTSTFDGILSSFVNFGQNIFNESKTMSERFRDLFKDLTNQLINMLMKVIMQALIMRAVTGLFNKGGGGTKIANTGIGESNFFTGLDFRAGGGYANGWTVVGENGPELVNFSSPGRVYTAEQTRNALGGGSGNVNIKIDLKNESGQQLQAETTGSSFDGENYIVGVVLKAISSNKYGMRTTLKGLANT